MNFCQLNKRLDMEEPEQEEPCRSESSGAISFSSQWHVSRLQTVTNFKDWRQILHIFLH